MTVAVLGDAGFDAETVDIDSYPMGVGATLGAREPMASAPPWLTSVPKL